MEIRERVVIMLYQRRSVGELRRPLGELPLSLLLSIFMTVDNPLSRHNYYHPDQ